MSKIRPIFFFFVFSILFLAKGDNFVLAAANNEIESLISDLKQQIEDYQQKILNLQKQITGLENQLVQNKAEEERLKEESQEWCHDFKYNMRYGYSGSEINALQVALKKEGFNYGNEKGTQSKYSYFGKYTAAAVIEFQEKHKEDVLIPAHYDYGTGYVGFYTRLKLNELYGCSKVEKPIEESAEAEPQQEEEEEAAEETMKEEPEEDISGMIREFAEVDKSGKIVVPAAGTQATGTSCFDSDGGKNYYEKGYVTLDEGEAQTGQIVDYCRYFYTQSSSIDMLYETYCQENEAKIEEYKCLLGCQDSACVEDMGAELSISSSTIVINPESPRTTENLKISILIRNVGNSPSAADSQVKIKVTQEEKLFFEATTAVAKSIESKGGLEFSYEIGKVFHDPGSYKVLLTLDSGSQSNLDFSVAKKMFCSDSDGGKDIYSRGYTTVDDGRTESWDYCSYDKFQKAYKLSENYCSGEEKADKEIFICSYGCRYDACLKKEMVAYWSFDDASEAESFPGKKGNALKLDGTNWIEIMDSDSLDLNYQGTIEVWVKYDDSGKAGAIISKCRAINNYGGCNYALVLNDLNNDSAAMKVGNQSSFSDGIILKSSSLDKNSWNHLTGVFDQNYVKIYLNGEFKGLSVRSSLDPAGTNSENILIGAMSCKSFGDCFHFSGLIDELKIYNYALSAEEIKSDYGKY